MEETNVLNDKTAAAWELRRALELLASKSSPPHLPAARPCKLTDLLDSSTPGLDLHDVNLRGAWLRGLDFGSSLLPTHLAGADLGEADLSSCDLRTEQLEQTRLLRSILPPGLTPPASALSDLPPRPTPLTTLFGHVRVVLCLAVLHDRRFLSGGYENAIHLWDPDHDQPRHAFPGNAEVLSLAPVSDRRFLSGHGNGKIHLWDVDQNLPVRTFSRNQDPVFTFVLLQDDSFLSAGESCTIYRWRLDQEPLFGMLRGHLGSVYDLIMRNNSELISAGADGLRFWNLDEGRCYRWRVVLDGRVVMTADDEGLHFTRLDHQPWRTVRSPDGPRPLPSDPLLHRYARFNADHRWLLPVYAYPDRYRWDDDNTPRRLTLPWPEDYDYQSVLGRAENAS